MRLAAGSRMSLACSLAAIACCLATASGLLIQPYNYMLDDSSHLDEQSNNQDPASLAPFYHEQHDSDVQSIISEQLAQLRLARMLHQQQESANQQEETGSQLSQEAADLAHEQQEASGGSLSGAVANLLLNAAHDSLTATSGDQQQSVAPTSGSNGEPQRSASQTASAGQKANGEQTAKSSQWFNPKEHIPVLKISSMATPSKYKKVYFRSEKKLVDGAFHSPSSEQEEKKSLIKSPFNSKVQRRSSRGSGSSPSAAPPSPLQDGVIDFLRKFREVYVQTRPAGSGSGIMAAAASSPLVSVLSQSSSSSSRPNLASAISAASSLVAQAAAVAPAIQSSGQPSTSSSSSSSSASSLSAAASAATTTLAKPQKSLLDTQNYVSFWSKTFPNWVRKMLKQMRRRSLQNHSRRQQQAALQHSASSAIGQATQAAASSAIASAIADATSNGQSNSESSSTSGSNSS